MIRETDPNITKMLDIAEKKKTGMTIVTASTGKRKTFEIVRRMTEYINSGKYKRVVFIEPRHTILDDVKKMLEDRKVEGILYLNNTKENTLNHIKEMDPNKIKNSFLKEKINELIGYCDSFEILKEKNKENLLDDLITRTKSEIKKYSIKNKKNLTKEELEELEKIFPEDIKATDKYILMTMDKLFFTLDVLKKENRILSSRIFNEETLVIIDELDKCYTIALNQLANNKDTLEDLLIVIQTAHHFIAESDHRWQRLSDEEENLKIEEEKKKLVDEINQFNEEFGILNNFVYEQNNDEKLELFVSKSNTFIASKNKHFKITKGSRTTTVKPCYGKTDFSIKKFAVGCKDLVRHILNFIYLLEEAYRKQDPDASYEDGLLYGISQVFNKMLVESDYYKRKSCQWQVLS